MAEQLKQATIQFDHSGFARIAEFSDGSEFITNASWTEIKRVIAFKRDLFGYDLLCIAFETDACSIESMKR